MGGIRGGSVNSATPQRRNAQVTHNSRRSRLPTKEDELPTEERQVRREEGSSPSSLGSSPCCLARFGRCVLGVHWELRSCEVAELSLSRPRDLRGAIKIEPKR